MFLYALHSVPAVAHVVELSTPATEIPTKAEIGYVSQSGTANGSPDEMSHRSSDTATRLDSSPNDRDGHKFGTAPLTVPAVLLHGKYMRKRRTSAQINSNSSSDYSVRIHSRLSRAT